MSFSTNIPSFNKKNKKTQILLKPCFSSVSLRFLKLPRGGTVLNVPLLVECKHRATLVLMDPTSPEDPADR